MILTPRKVECLSTVRRGMNTIEIQFLLGNEKVGERENYDHLGVKACIFEDDVAGIEERLAKGRRALNATSGLGIRNNGLTILACCIILWCVVIPIATYGAEFWILDDKRLKLIEAFQTFVGKRIQRLFSKAPNICAYFSLGWVRVERYIEIKKLLFVHSILSRDADDITKSVFIQRAKGYFNNIQVGSDNLHGSTVYDLLNTAYVFGIERDIQNMVFRGHLYSRAHWREKLWKRAWELEDIFWCIKSRCHRSLDMLSSVCHTTRYSIW